MRANSVADEGAKGDTYLRHVLLPFCIRHSTVRPNGGDHELGQILCFKNWAGAGHTINSNVEMSKPSLLSVLLAWSWVLAAPGTGDVFAADATPLGVEVTSFLTTYCLECHQGEKPKGKLDLEQFQTLQSMSVQSKRWARIVARVQTREMPPEGSKSPGNEERDRFLSASSDALRTIVCDKGPQPGPAPVRRLNRTEYAATLRDLLGIQASLGQMLPEEGAGGEGFDNAAETLFLSPLHAEKYLEAARAALDYGSKDPRSRRAFLSSRPGGESPATADATRRRRSRKIRKRRKGRGPSSSDSFRGPSAGRRAREKSISTWRLFEAAQARGEPFEQSLLFALHGVLVSPHFLFRLEEPNRDAQPRLVGHYEIASRLSYFLWASMPDEELFRLAAEGKLNEPEVLARAGGADAQGPQDARVGRELCRAVAGHARAGAQRQARPHGQSRLYQRAGMGA